MADIPDERLANWLEHINGGGRRSRSEQIILIESLQKAEQAHRADVQAYRIQLQQAEAAREAEAQRAIDAEESQQEFKARMVVAEAGREQMTKAWDAEKAARVKAEQERDILNSEVTRLAGRLQVEKGELRDRYESLRARIEGVLANPVQFNYGALVVASGYIRVDDLRAALTPTDPSKED